LEKTPDRRKAAVHNATWNAAFLLLTGVATLPAQSAPRLAWHTPSMDSVRLVPGATYRTGNTGRLLYDLYLPPHPRGRVPLIVIFNGVERPFRDLSLNIAWARTLAGSGFAAVTYDSDSGGTETNFTALLRAIGANSQVDIDRVGVWAASANVMTALPLVSDPRRTTIRAAVLSYGAAEVPAFRADLPLRFVRVGLDQPTLLHAQDSLIARALAANAPIEVVNHPSGEHPFEETLDSRAGARIVAGTVAFFERSLAPSFRGALAVEANRAEAGAAAYAGDWSRAVRAFAILAAEKPEDAELQRRLGDARLEAGDPNGAVTAYLRSRELGHWRRGDIAIGLIAAYAAVGHREQAFAEVANLPPMWNKADILRSHPMLAAYRADPEFIERMR